MRVARHSVRLPSPRVDDDGGDDEGVAAAAAAAATVDDWLWIDYHDRVNVLVEAPPPPHRLVGRSCWSRSSTR